MADTVEIFVTMGCPFCRKLMDWLAQYGVEHSRTVFTTTTEKMAFYSKHPGVRTVPQIFLNGERIGGWSDLQEHEFKRKVEENHKSA